MAWVRIHDGALSHPKLSPLVRWRDPLHVWLWGLSHTQQHLTDGFIDERVVPRSGRRAAEELVARRLWDEAPGGWRIHDYLDWNDSREQILRGRKKGKERLQRWRAQHERSAEQSSNGQGVSEHGA